MAKSLLRHTLAITNKTAHYGQHLVIRWVCALVCSVLSREAATLCVCVWCCVCCYGTEVIPHASFSEQLSLPAPLLLLLSWWGTFPASHFLPQDPLFMTECMCVCVCVEASTWVRLIHLAHASHVGLRILRIWFKPNVHSLAGDAQHARVHRRVLYFFLLHKCTNAFIHCYLQQTPRSKRFTRQRLHWRTKVLFLVFYSSS